MGLCMSDPITMRSNSGTVWPSPALCKYCATMCGHANVTPRHCAANSCPPPTSSPSNGYGSNLEGCTDDDQSWTSVDAATQMTRVLSLTPTLSGHPRHCAIQRCTVGTGQHHSGTCAASSRTFPHECETNRISANGNSTLCTSVIVPRSGYHVQSLSQVVQIHITWE
jgi:hypothetical protein